MIIDVDGRIYRFDVTSVSEKLKKATEEQRNVFVVSGSGYGIHWPSLDEDLSIDGLLKQYAARYHQA